jgi:hypothetical protein
LEDITDLFAPALPFFLSQAADIDASTMTSPLSGQSSHDETGWFSRFRMVPISIERPGDGPVNLL